MVQSALSKQQIRELIETALMQRGKAYVPYSGFRVGAALLTADGTIYTGCNIENASYGAVNCAERTAIFKAVSEGERSFRAICVVGGPGEGEPTEFCPPCGICRQVMMEFCDKEFEILLATDTENYRAYTLEELLPLGFSLEEKK